MKKTPQENNHHILGKSLVNEYKIDAKENIHRMNMEKHNALHKLFGCLFTPKEQMRELYYIYESVLNDIAKNLFQELIHLQDKDFYIPEVLRKNGKTRN